MTNTNTATKLPRLSISTWSLHRALGQPGFYGADSGQHIPNTTHSVGTLSLLEVPASIAAFGIHTLEICHFHLPGRDRGYLQELRSALEAANVELFSLLIDDGDITHPEHATRDLAWIGDWMEVASHLGAKCARVIAGKASPSDAALEMSYRGLQKLVVPAEAQGIRLMTENWFGLLSRPEQVLTLLDRLEGRVGLCLDFGNWSSTTKYSDLAAIAPRAESCHAKAHFAEPHKMDTDDFVRCLDLTRAAAFSGPYTLIYDGPNPKEWEELALERNIVLPYLSKA